MDYDFIFDRFKSLADIDGDEAEKWSYLISDCIVEIRNMLLPDCDIEANCRRLSSAAAALAFYRYRSVVSARGEADVTSFKAGDLTLNIDSKVGSSIDCAYRFYKEELDKISDLMSVNDFVFGRTETLCT